MAAVKPSITLYVDIISPFAYLAYYMLRNSPIFSSANLTITYTPILLGGLLKACDNRAPLEIRNKDKWINTERLRWADQFHIPMSRTFPPGFPKPTLPMMRFLTALDMVRPELLPVALDSLYAAFWTDEDDVAIGRDRRSNLADPAVFGPILSQVLGQEVVRDGLDRIASPQVKKQLVANTDRALDAGAFGLPWFQCRNARGEVEAFWGFDHLGQVVRFLGLDGRGEIRALL